MQITAKMVKDLRERTGVGMMDCKKALVQTEGDIEAAIKFLREKGMSKAAKKADRETKEGRVVAYISEDKKSGALVAINCETDFVARTDDFEAICNEIAAHVAQNTPATMEDLLAQEIKAGTSVQEYVTGGVAKLGENMQIAKFSHFNLANNGLVSAYVHSNFKVGVILGLETECCTCKLADLAKDVAMHITATNPLAIQEADLDQELIAKEREIYRQKALNDGKPEKIVDKIVDGQIGKYVKQNCLLSQEFVKDPDKTVGELIEETAKNLETEIKLVNFTRFSLGE